MTGASRCLMLEKDRRFQRLVIAQELLHDAERDHVLPAPEETGTGTVGHLISEGGNRDPQQREGTPAIVHVLHVLLLEIDRGLLGGHRMTALLRDETRDTG